MAMTAMELVAEAKRNIREIDCASALALLGKAVFIDVREPAEFGGGCLPEAINIPRGVLEFQAGAHPALQRPADVDVVVYCLSGGRSALATEALQKLGYTRAASMAGGFKAWQDFGGPIVHP